MKYHIITYGCQMNISDSERIAAILKLAKITPAKNMNKADLLIINSCSVRQSAINRIYGQLINFKKTNCHPERSKGFRPSKTNVAISRDSSVSASRRIPQNDKKITILTGCLLESDKKKFKDKFDLIIDIKELTDPENKAIEKLLKLIKPSANEQEFKAFEYTDYFKINPQYRSNFSAYVPIMTGCNNFCSYCAVPYTRGREISRPAEEIIVEVKRLIDKGYKEITLLGQNVNSYRSNGKNSSSVALLARHSFSEGGAKEDSPINFPRLLKLINDIPGKFWIRFLTSHPKDMSDELIETMAKCEKVCEYVHLPIQAGDDKILAKMNRRYTSVQYLKLIAKIKKAYKKRSTAYSFCHPESREFGMKDPIAIGKNILIPRNSSVASFPQNDSVWYTPIAISTDIIVGFPGETKKQFANTAKIMRKVKYDMAYLAQYSPRTGTAAAKLKDNVSIVEKKRRKEFLNDILRKTALANNKKYEGKIAEVLIEKVENGIATGKTRTFKNVRIAINPSLACHPESASGRTKDPAHQKTSVLLPRDSSPSAQNDTIKAGNFALIKITQANAWGLEGEIV